MIAAAGHLEHDRFVEAIRRSFGSIVVSSPGEPEKAPEARLGRYVLRKDLEQVHLIIGALAPSMVSPERHAGFLLNAVLAGAFGQRHEYDVHDPAPADRMAQGPRDRSRDGLNHLATGVMPTF